MTWNYPGIVQNVLEINEFSGNLGLFEIWNDDCCSISLKFEIPSTFLGKISWKLTQKCTGKSWKLTQKCPGKSWK